MAKKPKPIKTYCSGPQVEEQQREELKKMGVTILSSAQYAVDARARCVAKGDEPTGLKANDQIIRILGGYAPEKHEMHAFTWADVVGKKA